MAKGVHFPLITKGDILMAIEDLLRRIENLPTRPTNVPTPPPVEIVALMVRQYRTLRQWKVSTLADFARVSVSSVERVERGESVSDKVLDRIAAAFGRDAGFFTEPRIPLGADEVLENLVESYGHLETVAVSPMTTQRAVREAARCDGLLIHRPNVPDAYDADIETLREWLDLLSFELADFIEGHPTGKRRALYDDVLNCIRDLERRGLAILSGVMSAHGEIKIAVISITPKLSDPGAAKRKHVFVNRRVLNR